MKLMLKRRLTRLFSIDPASCSQVGENNARPVYWHLSIRP
jgi:hypothetical protein